MTVFNLRRWDGEDEQWEEELEISIDLMIGCWLEWLNWWLIMYSFMFVASGILNY